MATKKAKPKKKARKKVSKEKSIVQEVFSERNLKTQNIDSKFKENLEKIPVYHGSVRIEGDVTPEKLKLAEDFEQIFNQATFEVMDAFNVSDEAETFIRKHIPEGQIERIQKADPLTVFQIAGDFYIKTSDKKLEPVKGYCYRLEKAVLTQVQFRKQTEEKNTNVVNLLQDQLNTVHEQLALEISRRRQREDSLREYYSSGIAGFGLKLTRFYLKLKSKLRELGGKSNG